MDNFIVVARYFSLLLFGAMLLFAYYSLPETISLDFDQVQQPIGGITKDQMFYSSVIFLLLINLIFTFFVKFFEHMPVSRVKVPNRDYWLADKNSRRSFFMIMQAWAYSFVIMINLYCAFIIYRVYTVNFYNKVSSHLYLELGILGVLIVGWIVFIAFRYRIKRYDLLGQN